MTERNGEQRWTAHALPIRTGKVLLLHRNPILPLGGLWDIPGGVVAPGENPADAARREVAEETGLDVLVTDELTHFVNPDTSGRDIDFHTVTFGCFENEIGRAVHLPDDEHDEYEWMTYQEATHVPLVWHVRKTLDHADALGLLS
ncbi:NUDIX hydrolase [Nocardia goodfellowii]|uniref:8-oxo-dGTP diphosphatase n=1 Tax=Nocardia goodfellowii TaxID=882446 RepID=A0ABS4Q8U1_9NOCA|nr:NUDIX hydrolase [Nocardia goodfellowii]MBP2188110.1 8-oxo-dGTP diphosphatase [Nocardia goodfellowii]